MPNRKLTYSTAQKIRSFPKSFTSNEIIKLLNLDVNKDTVNNIRRGVSYRTLRQNRGSVLNFTIKKEINKEYLAGATREQLCVKYGVKYSTMRRVLGGGR